MSDITIDQQIAKVLFLIYVRLVDHEESIGLRDIERFDRLLEGSSVLETKRLDGGLSALRLNYPQLWQNYQAGLIGQGNEEISAALSQVPVEYWRRDWLEWRDALVQYIQYFAHESSFVARFEALHSKRKRRLDQAGLITVLVMNWSFANLIHDQGDTLAPDITQDVVELAQSAISKMLLDVAQRDVGISLARQGSHRLICVDVRDEAPHVKTFTFITESRQLWVYQPGQFMTFEIPYGDTWLRRSYSISSTPTQPYSLEITIKKMEGGKSSSWFHEHMNPGVTISARGPHGQFSVLNSNARKILMMAAGVGITPIISMLKWLSQSRSPCDVVVLNRVHSFETLIFANELAAIKRQSHGRIKIHTISSEKNGEWPKALGLLTNDSQLKRINASGLQELVPDILERSIYLCGTETFEQATSAALDQLGFDKRNYYAESFGGVGAEAPAKGLLEHLQLNEADQTSTIEFRKSGKTVRCAPGEYILDVAKFHGIAIESSCRMGSCGTCKCEKLEGAVVMDNDCGLSAADHAANLILTCVAKVPDGTVIINA